MATTPPLAPAAPAGLPREPRSVPSREPSAAAPEARASADGSRATPSDRDSRDVALAQLRAATSVDPDLARRATDALLATSARLCLRMDALPKAKVQSVQGLEELKRVAQTTHDQLHALRARVAERLGNALVRPAVAALGEALTDTHSLVAQIESDRLFLNRRHMRATQVLAAELATKLQTMLVNTALAGEHALAAAEEAALEALTPANLLCLQADRARADGRWGEARALLERATELDPRDVRAAVALATLCLRGQGGPRDVLCAAHHLRAAVQQAGSAPAALDAVPLLAELLIEPPPPVSASATSWALGASASTPSAREPDMAATVDFEARLEALPSHRWSIDDAAVRFLARLLLGIPSAERLAAAIAGVEDTDSEVHSSPAMTSTASARPRNARDAAAAAWGARLHARAEVRSRFGLRTRPNAKSPSRRNRTRTDPAASHIDAEDEAFDTRGSEGRGGGGGGGGSGSGDGGAFEDAAGRGVPPREDREGKEVEDPAFRTSGRSSIASAAARVLLLRRAMRRRGEDPSEDDHAARSAARSSTAAAPTEAELRDEDLRSFPRALRRVFETVQVLLGSRVATWTADPRLRAASGARLADATERTRLEHSRAAASSAVVDRSYSGYGHATDETGTVEGRPATSPAPSITTSEATGTGAWTTLRTVMSLTRSRRPLAAKGETAAAATSAPADASSSLLARPRGTILDLVPPASSTAPTSSMNASRQSGSATTTTTTTTTTAARSRTMSVTARAAAGALIDEEAVDGAGQSSTRAPAPQMLSSVALAELEDRTGGEAAASASSSSSSSSSSSFTPTSASDGDVDVVVETSGAEDPYTLLTLLSGMSVEDRAAAACVLLFAAATDGHAESAFHLGSLLERGIPIPSSSSSFSSSSPASSSSSSLSSSSSSTAPSSTFAGPDLLAAAEFYAFAARQGRHARAANNLGALLFRGALPFGALPVGLLTSAEAFRATWLRLHPPRPLARPGRHDQGRRGVGSAQRVSESVGEEAAEEDGHEAERAPEPVPPPADVLDREAFHWFSLSAEQGFPLGEVHAGLCFEQGRGVERDLLRAETLFERAARSDHVAGLTALGRLLAQRRGDAHAWGRAKALLRSASDRGSPDASYHLALVLLREAHQVLLTASSFVHRDARRLPTNPTETWLRVMDEPLALLASQHTWARDAVTPFLPASGYGAGRSASLVPSSLTSDTLASAASLRTLVADAGSGAAIAEALGSGLATAFRLLLHAAEAGLHPDATYRAGCALLAGVGTRADPVAAVRLFVLADERGSLEATNALGVIHLEGLPDVVRADEGKAEAFFRRVLAGASVSATVGAQARLVLEAASPLVNPVREAAFNLGLMMRARAKRALRAHLRERVRSEVRAATSAPISAEATTLSTTLYAMDVRNIGTDASTSLQSLKEAEKSWGERALALLSPDKDHDVVHELLAIEAEAKRWLGTAAELGHLRARMELIE